MLFIQRHYSVYLFFSGTAAYAADDRPADIPGDYTVNEATQADARDGEYDSFFPKDKLQEVRINVDEQDLAYLFNNALDKPYVPAESVSIGASTVKYAGLRTKGDYTLKHGREENDSNRFSFTVNFGRYVKKSDYGKKQSFYGLNRVCFNNFYFDKSMLKEYCAYTLFSEMGVPSSQFALTKLYINDEYYGVYFMMEALDHTILMQHYGMKKKDLGAYLAKPDKTDLEYEDILRDPAVLYNDDEETYEDVKVDLELVTEALRRLDALSKGRDFDGQELDTGSSRYLELLDTVINTDEFLRYFAVHSFLVQTDNMFTEQHNYGLYCDRNGRLAIIPWDYDLSFGTYFPVTADMTANYDVDIMYCMKESWQDYNNSEYSKQYYSSYPLFNVIYQNPSLMEKYHTYMMDCARIYALGGRTTDNRTYEPAYMVSLINGISDELIAAATEKNADSASYMNFIWQPQDVVKALPHIKQIVADRAVGVYSQLSGLNSWVSCGDCDLSAVGNGQKGKGRNKGYLSVTDPDTGIFVTAQYEGGTPGVFVRKYSEGDGEWNRVKELIPEAVDMRVYDLEGSGDVSGGYLVTVPMGTSRQKAGTKLVMYTVDDKGAHEVEAAKDGNLYSVSVSTLGRLVLAEVNDLPLEDTAEKESGVFNRDTLMVAGIAIGILAVAMILIELVSKLRKKKQTNT
ncbi:MAG: CotH kinase family protein [Lachnospiraceae bacterium]|nr:CotH kinase family protein [Lachnospiraceae bacterium]